MSNQVNLNFTYFPKNIKNVSFLDVTCDLFLDFVKFKLYITFDNDIPLRSMNGLSC